MFEKTLTDVVKGIRASKRDTSKYISQCIAEIKVELNSSDMFVKANALQKLTFLQMMGFSMNWDRASFATVEVMSSPRFAHKRVGYLAASQGFTQDTEVVLLSTNLLKKELRGAIGGGMNGVYEAGLAINCISNIVTEDLALDLLPELNNLTTHPQPYLRKKAVLCLFKVFVKYPQGLRLTFARLQQCLEDPNPSVVSCAVNVITELSDKNPKNYLHLAPSFFQLLTQSSNNWMLIKVVKLLGSLVPEEPRLARKLLEPLAKIVRTTQAKSLLYESVRTITLCLPYCRKSDGTMPPNVPEIVELCAATLLDFVKETDQNLKYLGLVGFSTLMQSHPHVLNVPEYRPLILACLSDPDVTIRTRALDLLTGMVSKKNLLELITQLLNHVELATGSYKKHLVAKIVDMCSGDKYSRMVDFKWYLDVLFQLGHYRGIEEHGELLMGQVINVAVRVAPVRPYAVRRSIELLLEGDGYTTDDPYGNNGRGKHLMVQVLPSIAWIVGEYADQIHNALTIDPEEKNGAQFSFNKESKGTYHAIIQCLTTPLNIQKLPTSTQKVYLQAALKTFAAAACNKSIQGLELVECVNTIHMNFPFYMQSTDIEVVERSFSLLELMIALGLIPEGMNWSTERKTIHDKEKVIDLLKIEEEAKTLDPPISVEKSVNGTSMKSLESKIRNTAETLAYLLKPTPMKPPPSKAQKKKRDAPIGVTINLEVPVDLSLFHDLILEEEASREGERASVRTISFTQQTPYVTHEPKGVVALNVLDNTVENTSSSNSQKPLIQNGGQPSSKSRRDDPFYLESMPSGDSQDGTDARRFETIQLHDSSDDESAGKIHEKKKKKKSKKGKSDVDAIAGWPTPDLAVFDSDDDAIDMKTTKRKGRHREFAGLAKVDLTTPLRDDEVMPQRTHRVVPEHKPVVEKKPKKSKKKASKVKESSTAVGDLLDLGGSYLDPNVFSSTDTSLYYTSSFAAQNPISTAFDDLLSMPVAPVPPMNLPAMSSNNSSQFDVLTSNASSKSIVNGSITSRLNLPWMKASLKQSKATGSDIDWTNVSVIFQAMRLVDGVKRGGHINIQINNRSSVSLMGLTLDVNGYGIVTFDVVPPLGISNQSGKIGPFYFDNPDTSQDIKAVLRSGSCSIPVTLTLPATLLLIPVNNLSLESVSRELSTSDWSSSSAKVDLVDTKTANDVKASLMSFLQAEIVMGSELSLETGTYAAHSILGTQVRFLVKVKDKYAKIDIKSMSSTLSKAIAADLKRLIL